MAFHVPEQFRITHPLHALRSTRAAGNNGAFLIPLRSGRVLRIIASDGRGWDHVSVSISNRCPSWDDMVRVKNLFWDPEDCVVQFHPPQSEYRNFHPHTLHLWRHTGGAEFPRPDPGMVGPAGVAEAI